MTLDRRRIPKHIHSASARPVHGSRCKTENDLIGCDVTGWQDQAEMTDTVIDEINHDSRFEKHVQKLWKEHARRLPTFFPLGHSIDTQSRRRLGSTQSHFDDLVIVTVCSASAPFWDPKRAPQSRQAPVCRLFTLVAFDWELQT